MNGTNIGVTLLQLLFIGLKLTGYIGWSWLWVLSPLWGSLLLIGTVITIVFTCFGGNKRWKIKL